MVVMIQGRDGGVWTRGLDGSGEKRKDSEYMLMVEPVAFAGRLDEVVCVCM